MRLPVDFAGADHAGEMLVGFHERTGEVISPWRLQPPRLSENQIGAPCGGERKLVQRDRLERLAFEGRRETSLFAAVVSAIVRGHQRLAVQQCLHRRKEVDVRRQRQQPRVQLQVPVDMPIVLSVQQVAAGRFLRYAHHVVAGGPVIEPGRPGYHDLVAIEDPFGRVRSDTRREPFPPVTVVLGGTAGQVQRLGQRRIVLRRLAPDVNRLDGPLDHAARPGHIDVVDDHAVVHRISEQPGRLCDGRARDVVVEPIAFDPVDQRPIRARKRMVRHRSAARYLQLVGRRRACAGQRSPAQRTAHPVVAAPDCLERSQQCQ